MTAGYIVEAVADQLTKDPVLKKVIGTGTLASYPSLSRFYTRVDNNSIKPLCQANQELLDKEHAFSDSKTLIVDLGSTHFDTYGGQE